MSLGLIFAGVVVSLVVQYLKKALDTTKTGTLTIMAIIAIVAAIIFSVLDMYGLTDSLLQMITTAGAFYAFIIKNVDPAE